MDECTLPVWISFAQKIDNNMVTGLSTPSKWWVKIELINDITQYPWLLNKESIFTCMSQ